MLRVDEICKEQGITMKDLAKRMGVSYQALYAVCSGNPTIGKVKEIADALNVHYFELLEQRQEIEIYMKYQGDMKRISESDMIEFFKTRK